MHDKGIITGRYRPSSLIIIQKRANKRKEYDFEDAAVVKVCRILSVLSHRIAKKEEKNIIGYRS